MRKKALLILAPVFLALILLAAPVLAAPVNYIYNVTGFGVVSVPGVLYYGFTTAEINFPRAGFLGMDIGGQSVNWMYKSSTLSNNIWTITFYNGVVSGQAGATVPDITVKIYQNAPHLVIIRGPGIYFIGTWTADT